MDNCLLDNSKNKDLSVDSDYLDKLFIYVSDYGERFYNLLVAYKKEIGQMSVFLRIKAKRDFNIRVGIPIDEVESLILEVNHVWLDIQRAINVNDLDRLEKFLRTYTYHRILITRCLSSFSKYKKELKLSKRMKAQVKIEKIENLLEDLDIVSQKLNQYLEEIYAILTLTE